LGREDAVHHLLNYVWPNIFETSPHVHNAVFEAIEGCRVALGPAVLINYVVQVRFINMTRYVVVIFVQGLFHPARKVRAAYWKVYNSMYIGCQAAMVASYPNLPDDGVNTYHRKDLEIFI